jgi:N-acetylneuraminate synthase
LQFLSTPFDHASVDLLVSLGVQTMKIPSGEITHRSLLHKVASTQLPVLLSTGMSSLGEIEGALGVLAAGFLGLSDSPADCEHAWLSEAGQRMLSMNVTLLHCTTEYPAPTESINLNAIKTLATCFGLPVGLSDHSEGIEIPAAAVALGAVCIEKHFTLDRSLPGPDHKASLEPRELAAMIKSIRTIEAAMGSGRKLPAEAERKNREVARRSLVAARSIAKGEIFSAENLVAKRPATGISPMRIHELIGQPAAREYHEDDLIVG